MQGELSICLLALIYVIGTEGRCKTMVFKFRHEGKVLEKFVFKKITKPDLKENVCRANCYMDDRCLSYNYISDEKSCELSESDHVMHPDNLVPKPGGVYYSAENTCQCSKTEICRYNFIAKTFKCECNTKDSTANCGGVTTSLPATTPTSTSTLITTSAPTNNDATATTTSALTTTEATPTSAPTTTDTATSAPTTTEATTTPAPTTTEATTTTTLSPTTTEVTTSECQLDFPRASTSDFVKISPAFSKAFTEFTLAFWLKVPSSYQKKLQIFSYKTEDGSSSFSVGIKSDEIMIIQVNEMGKGLNSKFKRDDTWQHIVVIWRNSDGNVTVFKNGEQKASATGMSTGETVLSDGVFHLGQTDGGFDDTKVIQGSIADLQIWRNAVDYDIVPRMYAWKCASASKHKPEQILSWETIIKSSYKGQVTKVCPATCLA